MENEVRAALNPADYGRVPNLGTAHILTVSQQLAAAAPSRPPPWVKLALARMRESTGQCQAQWAALALNVEQNGRSIDQLADGVWAAACLRVEAATRLPADRYPSAVIAARLFEVLFPDRLSFTQLEYEVQWAEMEKRHALLDGRSGQAPLKAEFIAIVGEEIYGEIVRTHKLYAEMVGASAPREGARPGIKPATTRLRKAIGSYVHQLLAWADAEPEAGDVVRSALLPFDAARALSRGGGGDSAPEPDAEIDAASPSAAAAASPPV